MPTNTVDFAIKKQFVDALLACQAIKERATRDAIVNALEGIQGIRRTNTDHADVAGIVDRVFDFDGGMGQLIEVLRFYEGDSKHMKRVDALYDQLGEPIQTPSIPDEGRTYKAPSSFNYRPFWALVILILLAGIMGIGWLVGERFPDDSPSQLPPTLTQSPTVTTAPTASVTPLPTATPLPFAPATEGETLILVNNFYLADGIGDAEPHRKIAKAIREAVGQYKLENVRVEIEETQLREDEQEAARELAALYDASIIIWGDETSTDITVNFLNLRQPAHFIIEADEKNVHNTILVNPEPYNRFITQDLPDQVTCLALYTLASFKYNDSKYTDAITICESTTQQEEDSQIEGLEQFYFYLGWLHQTLTEDTEQSIDYYAQAIELVPTFAAAYHNRGLVYGAKGEYEQALVDLDKAIELSPNNGKFADNQRLIHSFMNNFVTSTPTVTATNRPTMTDTSTPKSTSTDIPTQTPQPTPTNTPTPTTTYTGTSTETTLPTSADTSTAISTPSIDGPDTKMSAPSIATVVLQSSTATPISITSTVAPTSTSVPPTDTTMPPTSTVVPTSTSVPPTYTTIPPTSTVAPTSTSVPPTYTTMPPTSTFIPTSTPVPPTLTFTSISLTSTLEPDIGSTYISPVDEAIYVYVPAGEFIMGSSDEQTNYAYELCTIYYGDCQRAWYDDEQPQHTVYLDSYWIMQTEVTNGQYRKFMNDSGYTTEAYWDIESWSWLTEKNIASPQCWDDINFNGLNQPVVCISWYEAKAYAIWLSAETGLDIGLPTEAQWEKAARGADGRYFPWGNEWESNRANYCDKNCTYDWADKENDDSYQYTATTTSYPTGISPYGLLEIAGNVWEWTADWYVADYYQNSISRNPPGPTTGALRVLRGGSYVSNPNNLRAADRSGNIPTYWDYHAGFRLVLYTIESEN